MVNIPLFIGFQRCRFLPSTVCLSQLRLSIVTNVYKCVSSKNGKAFFIEKKLENMVKHWKFPCFFWWFPLFSHIFDQEMGRGPITSRSHYSQENGINHTWRIIPQNDDIPGINIYIWNNSWDRWWLLYGKIPDKGRFIAGKFIYKWWCSMAMLVITRWYPY